MATLTQPFTGTFTSDPAHSSFQAAVKHMGVGQFRPTFDDVDAELVADENGLRLRGAARVESISITRPPEFREHVVNGADFFDATNHPEITFASERIELGAAGADQAELTLEGRLTIRGITRDITATGRLQEPVEDPYGSLRTAIELKTQIDRRDFGLDWQAPLPKGGQALGWDVAIEVHVELVQQGA